MEEFRTHRDGSQQVSIIVVYSIFLVLLNYLCCVNFVAFSHTVVGNNFRVIS